MNGWSHIEIAGKPARLFEPKDSTRFALLWLGPQDGVVPAQLGQLLKKYRIPAIAPDGKHSWWADRVFSEFDPSLTPQQHLLQNVVPWIESRFSLPGRSVAVGGMEMG